MDANSTTESSTPVNESGTLLCLDDEPHILSSLRRLFRPLGYEIFVFEQGSEALKLLETRDIDVIVSDMRMPGMDGAEFLHQAAKLRPDSIRILLTGYTDMESAITAINEGKIYRYTQKPWNDQDMQLLVQQAMQYRRLVQEKKQLQQLTQERNRELKHLNETLETRVEMRTQEIKQTADMLEQAYTDLKNGYTAAIQVFANLIEIRNSDGQNSSRQVAETAGTLAEQMGMNEQECEAVYFAGLLHDLGKLCLPDALTNKPYTKLDEGERLQFHQHPLTAESALTALAPLSETARLIRCHCERFDSKGYPDNLGGDAIPLGARILSVASDYQTLQQGKLIDEQLTAAQAREFIANNAGAIYDPQVVDELLQLLEQREKMQHIPQELKLNSDGLKAGMVLSRDLVNTHGLLILAKGFRITEHLAGRLRQLEQETTQALVIYVVDRKDDTETAKVD